MPRVSLAFFAVGVAFLLTGMCWGMYMGRAEDMVTAPAHAHLNLLGWVTMAIYGTFYALIRQTLSARLAWANWIVSTLGVAIMIPSLALFLANGNDPKFVPFLVSGQTLSVAGLLIFAVSVGRELLRKV